MPAMQHAKADPCRTVGMHPAMLLHAHLSPQGSTEARHEPVSSTFFFMAKGWFSGRLTFSRSTLLKSLHGLKVSAAHTLS